MFLWRISNHINLDGLGGERADGRWHTAEEGKRIVYLAEHPALALVETLVNLRGKPEQAPEAFQLIKLTTEDLIPLDVLGLNSLAANWRENLDETRFIGDSWLKQRTSALLAVPSAPSPESTNYLLNPLHPEAKQIVMLWHKHIAYDKRLFRI